MFEKKEDYDKFIELSKKLYDETGKNKILRILNSIHTLHDENNMNLLVKTMLMEAIKYKYKSLIKFILEKYNFTVNSELDMKVMSNINDYIKDKQTKYSIEFVDSLILIIYNKYKNLFDENNILDFVTYWILFFHPEKLKDYISYIYSIDYERIFRFLTIKSGHSLISPKHLSKTQQKQKIISILFKYLKDAQQETFYEFIEEFVYTGKKHKKYDFNKEHNLQEFISLTIELIEELS